MPITADVILAIGTFFTAMMSGAVAFYTFLNSATRQEATDLRKRVVCLERENLKMHNQVIGLQRENMWLRLVLTKAGIEIPPLPIKTIEEAQQDAKDYSDSKVGE